MECKLCKGYLYQNGVQLQPATMPIYFDDDIWDRYKNYDSWEELIPTTNVLSTNTVWWRLVNDTVGVNLINKSFPMYMMDTPSFPYTPYRDGFTDKLGFNIDPVSTSDTPYMNFVTLDGVSAPNSCPTSNSVYFHIYTPFIRGQIVNNSLSAGISIIVFPHSSLNAEGKIADRAGIEFSIAIEFTSQILVKTVRLQVRNNPFAWGSYAPWLNNFNINGTQPSDVDPDNPYGDDTDTGGDGPNEPVNVDPTDFPELPDVGVGDMGLITIYRPTFAQLQSLGGYLWTGLFDLNNFKKLFSNPMDAIVGLSIVPASPAVHTGRNFVFGNVDTGIGSNYVTTQYCSVACGSVTVKPKIKDFLDYEATKVSIFLPYIGFRELSTQDVMNQTLTVQYNVDVLSGACAAFIKVGKRGVMYAYNGSCISNVPLTATNYSTAIQNAITAVASGAGIVAGAVSGAAPVTAMSAASLISSAANTVINSKPSIQRSGNLGGSAGIMSGKKPFIIIERPTYSVPDFYQNYVGRMCNKTAKLGSLSGFTMVDQIHLEGVSATAGEISEIEALLKAGVIL